MKRFLAFFSPVRKSGLIVVLVLALGLAAFVLLPRPSERVYSLKLSTGRIVVPPKRITQFFLERGDKHKLKMELVDVDGSEDSLDRIQRHELDLAVIKGGIRLGERTDVCQVTALDVEPFHLLVKKELAAAVVKDYGALAGKRININKPPTGTYYWSLDILRFAGLHPGDFTPATLGNPELLKQLALIESASAAERDRLRDELPDAILLADPVPSPFVRRLIHLGQLRLVPLKFGPAYIMDRHAAPPHEFLDSDVMIESAVIPAFTYNVSPAVPDAPCPTIGLRRLLVANKKVPTEAIVRVLELIYDEPSSLDFLDWTKVHPEYDLHLGVTAFEERRKQVLQHTIMRWIEKLASVLGGVIGAVLGVYGYFRYRRLLRFEYYFHEIRRIDLIARGKHLDPDVPTDRTELLAYLQNRLADLRTAAIAEFAKGRLQGESLILSIFTLIQDTSANLPSLLVDKNK